MQISTGRTITEADYLDRLAEHRIDPADWLLVTGTPEQVAAMSRRVTLGAAEIDRRRSRRRQQRASRRANRR